MAANHILFPGFAAVGFPTVPVHQVKRSRFHAFNAAESAARAQIQAYEDRAIFAALDAAAGITRCMHRIPLHECHEPECVVRSVVES